MRHMFLALLLSIALAYALMPCEPPMRKVGLRCCLDMDGNDICDDEDGQGPGSGACETPYIRRGGQCCLDINGNGACDSGEALASSSTVPRLSIRTTSTLAQTTTTVFEGTSTTASTSTVTTSSSTTTTLSALAMAGIGGCYDTDGGDNYDFRGDVAGPARLAPHDMTVVTDVCERNDTLKEYRCQNGLVYSRLVLCASEQVCEEGECCLPESSACMHAADCCSGQCRKRLAAKLCI